jgi:hypothetical protein
MIDKDPIVSMSQMAGDPGLDSPRSMPKTPDEPVETFSELFKDKKAKSTNPIPERLIKKRERIMDKNIEASKVDRSAPASSGVQKRMDNVQSRAAAKSKRIMDEGYNTRNMLKSGITKAKAQNKVNKIYDRSKK